MSLAERPAAFAAEVKAGETAIRVQATSAERVAIAGAWTKDCPGGERRASWGRDAVRLVSQGGGHPCVVIIADPFETRFVERARVCARTTNQAKELGDMLAASLGWTLEAGAEDDIPF